MVRAQCAGQRGIRMAGGRAAPPPSRWPSVTVAAAAPASARARRRPRRRPQAAPAAGRSRQAQDRARDLALLVGHVGAHHRVVGDVGQVLEVRHRRSAGPGPARAAAPPRSRAPWDSAGGRRGRRPRCAPGSSTKGTRPVTTVRSRTPSRASSVVEAPRGRGRARPAAAAAAAGLAPARATARATVSICFSRVSRPKLPTTKSSGAKP